MVEQLSYIGFTLPKAAAWREFSATVLGAELTAASSAEAVRLRLDDAAWRIAVPPGEGDGLA